MRNQISPHHELGLQDARIERLEAALAEIEEVAGGGEDITHNGGPNGYMKIKTLARSALARP